MNEAILSTALRFHNAGISVVPVAGDGSKRPAIAWKEFQSRRPTTDELLAWFSDSNVQGLGVITGEVSGNLELLEWEGRAVSKDLHLEAKKLIEAAGLGDLWLRLVNGYMEITPSKGIHFLYRVDGELPGNTKLASEAGENGGCLIETRSEGGFCITAPSGGTAHPSGKAWEMASGSIDTIPTITLAEREELFCILRTFDEVPHTEAIRNDVTKTELDLSQPGDDYSSKVSWVEILEPAGWKRIFTDRTGVTFWRRPGKNEGISASTGFGDYDNFYVFTTSTTFEANKSYSKFAVYAHLHARDDFRLASQQLRSLGYGSQGLKSIGLADSVVGKKPEVAYDPDTGEIIEEDFHTTWEAIDLEGYFDGLFTLQEATLLKRTDGAGLLYPGKVHSFYGESESGKSWLAQIACAEVVKSYQKVVYIDFESDALDIANRLKILGVTKPEAMAYFRYIRPERRVIPDDPSWLALLEEGAATLIVIDGVTEALTMWEKATKENDDITAWMREFPRALAKSGAAVVLVDHITKNAETRGRFAIGGQAKLATIDGAAYLIEPIRNLAPGAQGALTVRVTKDRPGSVRRKAGAWRKSDRTQEAAVIEVDSSKSVMQYIITVPMLEDEIEENKEFKKSKEIIEFIHNNPGATRRIVQEGVTGAKEAIGERISDLLAGGWIENKGNERSFVLYVTDEGKGHFNLLDAKITQLKAN